MFYSFGTSFLVAVNGQAHPFPSVIAWNACYISLSGSSLTHQRSRRESPYLSQLPPTKPRDLLGYWIHSIRCSVNLVKHFHLIILYPMLMCFTFPLRILTHIQSKPKPPSNQVRFDSGESNDEGDEDDNDDDQDGVKERRGHRED